MSGVAGTVEIVAVARAIEAAAAERGHERMLRA